MSNNIIYLTLESILDILRKKGRKWWKAEGTQITYPGLLKIRTMGQAGVHIFSQMWPFFNERELNMMSNFHGKSVKVQNLKLGIYFINSPLFLIYNIVLLPVTFFLFSIRTLPKKIKKKKACKKSPIFITGTYFSKCKMKSQELRLD